MNNASRLGLGLLTSENITEKNSMIKIIEWCILTNINILNIRASTISPLSYKALHYFVNN